MPACNLFRTTKHKALLSLLNVCLLSCLSTSAFAQKPVLTEGGPVESSVQPSTQTTDPVKKPTRELNTLNERQINAGWKLLFDGKTLDGWKIYQADKPVDGEHWKVENGAMSLVAPDGKQNLITADEFENFELALDFKISEGGNSGIIFHCDQSTPQPYMTGPEVQVLDNIGNTKEPQKTGYLYALYKPEEGVDPYKEGKWNHLVVHIDTEGSWVKLNGEKMCDFVIGSDDWNEKVAASKFSKWEKFGTLKKGHICLQDHNDAISFRNIMIRELE